MTLKELEKSYMLTKELERSMSHLSTPSPRGQQ